MCDLYDGEYAQLWNEKVVRARKQYRCSCCAVEISPGTKYMKHFSLYDGDVTTGRLCLACKEARDAFVAAGHVGMAPQSVYADLGECLSEYRGRPRPSWAALYDAICERQIAAQVKT